MSVAITGAVPRPVPPPSTGLAQDGRYSEEVKVFPPMFTPFVSVSVPYDPKDSEEMQEENWECCDYTMSSDVSGSLCRVFSSCR